MKNIFKFLVVMILALSLLASCTAPDGSNSGNNGGQTGGQTGGNGDNTGDTGDSGDNSGDEGDEGEGDVVIEDKYADSVSGDFEGWLANDNVYLCSESNIPADQLVAQFKNNTNVTLKTTVAGEHDKLFMLGEIDHDLSAYAYERLDVLVSDDPNNTIFVICTDGTSVAIAYNSLVARYRALEYFFEEYENLDLTKGGVISHKGDDETKAYLEFDTIEYVDETRAALRDETFAELGNTLDAEAIAQLRLVYDMYDSDVYSWLANLYDNGIGAFYYANASRTYKGFLPDLESTAQALIFLKNSGMISHYGNSYANALPEEMKDAIVTFTKGLQDSQDGYFYHPQWGKEIAGTRKGRDLGWVREILNGFGAQPYWDVPNGMVGELGAPGASATASVLTANLNTSTAVAVSKVVAVSTTAEEDAAALESAENLIAFLQTHSDFKRGSGETATFNSYTAGNWIESNLGQIQNKGFGDELIAYLDSIYNSETGLWEDVVNYGSVNGLMKLSVVYKSFGASVPNPEKSLESAIAVLTSTEDPEHVCSVYNPWAAIANLISGLSAEDKATFSAQLRADAKNLIGITYEKLSVFQRDDGGFSYYPKYSSPSSQGSLVTLEKQKESDVNATMICVNSTMTAMFGAMGITEAPRYYPVDFALFSDVLNSLEPPIKKDIPAAEPVTFEDFNEETSETEKGVVKYPVADIESVVTNVMDTEEDGNGNYKWFQNAVVQNPLVDDDTDLVLYTKVITEKVDGQIVSAAKPSNTKFYIPNAGLSFLGNCFVYEADMYFKSGYSDIPLQLQFMSGAQVAAMLNFEYYTDTTGDTPVKYVKIGEGYTGPDGVKNKNVAGDIRTDAWVKVRIELYKIYEAPESGSDLVYKPLIKIYVDNVFKGECDSVYGDNDGRKPYDRNIHDVTLSFYRSNASEIYLNNVLVERCNKTYKWEPDPKPQDTPVPDGEIEEVEDFEDGLIVTPTVQNKAWVKYFGQSTFFNATEGQTYNPYIAYSVVADPEDAANKVLKVVISKDDAKGNKPSRTEVPLNHAEYNGTNYTFSADFYYESASVKDDMSQILITNSSDKILYGLRITKASAAGGVVINSYKYGTGYTSTQIVDGLEIGKWFNLKVVFTKTNDEATTKAEIYIDNVLKATDTNFNKDYALDPDINVNKAVISHYRLNATTLYLDDVSFARDGELETSKVQNYDYKFLHDYVTSYLSEAADAKTAGDLTYEQMNNITPTRFYIVDADRPTVAQNDSTIVGKVDDIKNKCLRVVVKNFSTAAQHTKAHTDVKISNDVPAGSCYTFESKIFLDAPASSSKAATFAEIQFRNASGAAVLALRLTRVANSNNIGITSTGGAEAVTVYEAGTIENVSRRGGWFTVRAEYYHEGTSATDSNTYLKLYINDTLTYQGVAYGAADNLATEISYASIVHWSDAHTALYDDIQFTRTEKAYAED